MVCFHFDSMCMPAKAVSSFSVIFCFIFRFSPSACLFHLLADEPLEDHLSELTRRYVLSTRSEHLSLIFVWVELKKL